MSFKVLRLVAFVSAKLLLMSEKVAFDFYLM